MKSKKGFTMAEIVVAMVVMAVIVSVVVPITRDKFEKIDYASYYLGYRTLKEYVAGLDFFTELRSRDEEEAQECSYTLDDGTCFVGTFHQPEPITKSECLEIKDQYGIGECIGQNRDYGAGIVKSCGGVDNLPTTSEMYNLVKQLFYPVGGQDRDSQRALDMGLITSLSAKLYFATNQAAMNDSVRGIVAENGSWFSSYCYGSGRNADSNTSDPYKIFNRMWTICKGKPLGTPPEPVTSTNLCSAIVSSTNNSVNNCSNSVADVINASTSKDFSSVEPHVVFPSGIKLYLASDFAEIAQLDDSLDEDDRIGFTIYVDVDGNKSKSRLYDDVFPFYLTKSGKVIPGYDSSIVAGANCEKNLAFDVLYDVFDALGNRQLKSIRGYSVDGADEFSFKNAACISGYVKSQKYCGIDPAAGVTVGDVNCFTSPKADCRLKVRKPLRIFN